MSNITEKNILVGAVSSPHGIKGEVVINTFTANPENITNLQTFLEDGSKLQLIFKRKFKNAKIVCAIPSITTRNQAEALKGKSIFCLRSDFPTEDENEFYVEDLKGAEVFDLDKVTQVGVISEVFNYGAGDIIEIHFKDEFGGKKELFPFTQDFFPTLEKEKIIFNRTLAQGE